MPSHQQQVKHWLLPTLAGIICSLALAGVFRLTQDHWPSLGYCLSLVFVAMFVTLPALWRTRPRKGPPGMGSKEA